MVYGGHLFHPDNFKAAYPIYSIFNILHSIINSQTASLSTVQKFRGDIGSWRPSLIFVKLEPCHSDDLIAAQGSCRSLKVIKLKNRT